MGAEVAEQPQVRRRLPRRRAELAALARSVTRHAPSFMLLVEILPGLPVAVSQSGSSPDLVRTVVGRAGGALTLAVTNDPGSDLDRAAELHLNIGAGTERAVAATISYTAQLLALFLLFDHLRGGDGGVANALPELGETVLARAAGPIAAGAARTREAQRLVVTGRGYADPTAREATLKLMETSYLSAQAFSGADVLHGPVAMLDQRVPVFAVVPAGVAGDAMAQVLPRIRAAQAELFVVGTVAALAAANVGFALPDGVAEEVSPLLEILPFQLLALHLAVARGENPDAPRGLRKATRTV